MTNTEAKTLNYKKHWASLSDAAAMFGVSRHSMKVILKQEQVPVLQLGTRVRIDQEVLADLYQRRYKALEA